MKLMLVVIIMLMGALGSLGMAAYYLVSQNDHGRSMARSLAWRISLSLGLFTLLMLGGYLGWWQPHQS